MAEPTKATQCGMAYYGDEYRCSVCGVWTYAYNDVPECPLNLPRKTPDPSKGSNLQKWINWVLPKDGRRWGA